MSLHLYRAKESIPDNLQFVLSNDLFFITATCIPDTPLVREELAEVDNVEYHSETDVLLKDSKLLLQKDDLSTGTKTFLNILQHPQGSCFETCECDDTVMGHIMELNAGHILIDRTVLSLRDKYDNNCDIYVDDRHFTKKTDVLYYCDKGFLDEDIDAHLRGSTLSEA